MTVFHEGTKKHEGTKYLLYKKASWTSWSSWFR